MPSGAREPLKRTSKKKGEYLWLGIIIREAGKRVSRIFPK
jgi:hypothetical protein